MDITPVMEELRVEDAHSRSSTYLRMEPAMFDELVQRVGQEKQDTNMRTALPTGL